MTGGRPLGRFLGVGAVNTLIGLGVIYACKRLLGFGDVLANVSGYAVGLTIGFMLNRHWTFGRTGNVRVAALRFLAVFGIAYSVNLLCVLLAIRAAGLDDYVSQAIGILPYTAIFYLGSRLYAFRSGG
ncbi:MAG: GtrA family protein [Pseudomonadota bacterium]|nr:GtrA family protein [Pseudomonadota bacterium]